MAYVYNPEMAANGSPGGDWPVLEEGDYPITVTSCSFPAENFNGYDVIKLELLVEGQRIWDNRSAGISPKGEFDMISPFLAAINRIPKPGQEKSPVFWASLAGAKGKAHLVQDEYKGKVRNKVAWYHAPKVLVPTHQVPPSDKGPSGIDPDDNIPF
jgi:hypothetical protein